MAPKYPITVPAISVTQPLGTFYVVSLPARVLLDTAYSDRLRAKRSADGETYELEGSQRGLLIPRLRDIGAYISGDESTFPNSIILAPNFDPETGEPIEDDDENGRNLRWHVDEVRTPGVANGVSYTLTIPTNAALAPIIDGQHRLFGFNFCDKPERLDTELVCSLFLDLPKPFQAFLFATINSNQKPVDKSQTFELFGYNIEKEAPGNWSPDKLAVYFARKLNSESDSPLYRKILVAAENDFALTRAQAKAQGKWMVSMATIVEGISRLFSQNTKRDRTVLLSYKFGERNREILAREAPGDKSPLRELYLQLNDKVIYTAVKNFLIAAQELFWSKCSPDSFICKTVGVQALFDVLLAIAREGFATKTFSVEFFINKLGPAAEIDFGNERFKNASGSGRLFIKNCIFVKAGLEKEKIESLKERQRKEIDEAIE
ncbi:MAG: DGQHR domain-containing protein [Pseudomonadota bacterium]